MVYVEMRKKVKFFLMASLPDRIAIKLFYFFKFGKLPNLKNPKTLNEKIQWLKLYDRTNLHTICADKLAVREFVKEKIGEDYLIPLLFYTDDVNSLTYEIIPNFPVIIKSNHNSGDYFIIRDKNAVNIEFLKKRFQKSLSRNYYDISKEWQYKDIKPKILVEKLLLNENNEIPEDYKIHCFNGKPVLVQVDLNRGKKNHSRNWYSPSWDRMPFKWSSKYNGRYTDPDEADIPKPKNLSKMLKLSQKLAKDFILARIDWYNLNGKLYFGEITFHHDGGFAKFDPAIYDYILGGKLII